MSTGAGRQRGDRGTGAVRGEELEEGAPEGGPVVPERRQQPRGVPGEGTEGRG